MKVGVIGNTNWQSKRKVVDSLQSLKQKFGSDLTIVGAGGPEGANAMVKKYALEFGLNYKEFNPSFSGYNLYSAMPESYYGKKYHFSQLHHRMQLLVKDCDYVLILCNEELDPVLKTAHRTLVKLQKPVVILS